MQRQTYADAVIRFMFLLFPSLSKRMFKAPPGAFFLPAFLLFGCDAVLVFATSLVVVTDVGLWGRSVPGAG